ncbi:pyruvate dehydrogenase complex E1 component subunit beta [bacterium]|nr:pyruvate dehydrogenase complex E1 component subunit beta [bacterium]
MPVIQMREALGQAMAEEMDRDPDVFLMGEEVGHYQGAYKVSQGLLERFGEKRVIDTPINENGFCGLGVGAAIAGLRPIVELMTFNFSLVAIDAIVNSAAKARLMSGGQVKVPIVFRGAGGAGGRLAAQHSQSFESYYSYVPGLRVVCPSTPRDAKGLLKTSIRDDNPVVFIENERLYGLKGEVPEGEITIPLGKGDTKREGKDLTIVAWSRMVHLALEAAAALEMEGFDCEVWDPRTLKPLDEAGLVASVKKTNRCVVVEEGWRTCGYGGEIAYTVQREAFDWLDAPVERVTTEDVPMPYADSLEKRALPSVERIVEACKRVAFAVILLRKSGDTVAPAALNLFKNTFAFLLLIATMRAIGAPLWPTEPSGTDWTLLFVSGLLGLGVCDTLFLMSLNRIGAGRSAIVDCFYSPCVILCAVVYLGESVGWPVVVAAALIGAAVLVGTLEPKKEETSEKRARLAVGVALGLLAMLTMAVGIVIAKPVLARVDPWWAITVRLAGGVIVPALTLATARGRAEVAKAFVPSASWRTIACPAREVAT